jgi:hypothetical protein
MIRAWLTMGQEYYGIVFPILIGRCHWFCMVRLSVMVHSHEGSVGGNIQFANNAQSPKRRNV